MQHAAVLLNIGIENNLNQLLIKIADFTMFLSDRVVGAAIFDQPVAIIS